ncbi:MAG: 16S rRNA (cytosine(1402)-N(4))-methyltransferase RsmH [Alkalispirochaeta sp.]
MDTAHVSVMPDEVERFFSPLQRGLRICDATLGGGGHTARLLKRCPSCRFVGIDADERMIALARERLGSDAPVTIVHGWFDEVLMEHTVFDRILLDLGVSMVHLRDPKMGFSFREDGPLDMRLNASPGVEGAAELLRRIPESELADIIYRYGEERYSRRIAAAICRDRAEATRGTASLAEIIRRAVPPAYRRGRNHPATRTFQAIRIAVNDELGRIERGIPAAATSLAPAGRLVVITFHSLEDRVVKHTFRALAGVSTTAQNMSIVKEEGEFAIVTKKPVVPHEEEVARNPAARSAKMRVLERRRRE